MLRFYNIEKSKKSSISLLYGQKSFLASSVPHFPCLYTLPQNQTMSVQWGSAFRQILPELHFDTLSRFKMQ